jgi:hypothetical protein
LADVAIACAGLNASDHIPVALAPTRLPAPTVPVGDPSRARSHLGWRPTVSFEHLVQRMVDADLRALGGCAKRIARATGQIPTVDRVRKHVLLPELVGVGTAHHSMPIERVTRRRGGAGSPVIGLAAEAAPTHATTSSLLGGPAFHVGPEPELHPSLTKVDYRARHVGVPVLVLAHGVPMRQG